jgi:hypothetical protein
MHPIDDIFSCIAYCLLLSILLKDFQGDPDIDILGFPGILVTCNAYSGVDNVPFSSPSALRRNIDRYSGSLLAGTVVSGSMRTDTYL